MANEPTRGQSRPESETVRKVARVEEGADSLADVIREMAARVEERTAEAVEMRIRLELTEQAQSTIQEQARKIQEEARQLREENEQLRQELEALREPRELSERVEEAMDRGDDGPDEGAPYGTSRQEAQDSLQRRPSWWRRFFGLE